jgi:hypothetical protein
LRNRRLDGTQIAQIERVAWERRSGWRAHVEARDAAAGCQQLRGQRGADA